VSAWQHAGAYVAAFAVTAIGCVGIGCGVEWPGVVAIGLAVGLLLGFRALETLDGRHRAQDVAALVAQVAALKAEMAKATETAEGALRTARAANESRKHTY